MLRPPVLRPRRIGHQHLCVQTEAIQGFVDSKMMNEADVTTPRIAGEEVSIHLDRVVPVYPLTEGLPQRWLRSLIWRTLASYGNQIEERFQKPDAGCRVHAAPSTSGRQGAGLETFPHRREAIRWLHFPDELAQAERARQRLALDEFIELQIQIQTRRRNLQAKARGLPCAGDNRFIKPFLARLSEPIK